jgi:uncharacterized protein
MILKLLLILGVIYIVYVMFIKQKPKKQTPHNTQTKKTKEVEVDDMIECSSCGVYVALSESILSNGHYYCSKECVAKAS